MAPTPVFSELIIGPYTPVPVSPTNLNLSWTAADPVNGNQFIYDSPSGDILLAWNRDYTTPHNFTLTSTQDDPFLRLGDIQNYEITAGQIMAYNLGNFPNNIPTGWGTLLASTYYINFSADSPLIYFSILQR